MRVGFKRHQDQCRRAPALIAAPTDDVLLMAELKRVARQQAPSKGVSAETMLDALFAVLPWQVSSTER